jgi:hypothetical protein
VLVVEVLVVEVDVLVVPGPKAMHPSNQFVVDPSMLNGHVVAPPEYPTSYCAQV